MSDSLPPGIRTSLLQLRMIPVVLVCKYKPYIGLRPAPPRSSHRLSRHRDRRRQHYITISNRYQLFYFWKVQSSKVSLILDLDMMRQLQRRNASPMWFSPPVLHFAVRKC